MKDETMKASMALCIDGWQQMTNCTRCEHGEYHGFRRDGYHSTIFFWCPIRKSHVSHRIDNCPEFTEGTPGRFDAKGERIG